MPYLFVHFREKKTPDGEQVHFALSDDGFSWQSVNGGKPVLTSVKGEKGVRDFTIVRLKDNSFVILATDLSLANSFETKYHKNWGEISTFGSHELVLWRSKDLVNWDEQEMITLGGDELGCRWAPDVVFDKNSGDYILHFSSSRASNNFGDKAIYFVRTKDFLSFSEPQLLFEKVNSGVIDSCIVENKGLYYLFIKSENRPKKNQLYCAPTPTGPYTRLKAFDKEMKKLESGVYEAPTAFQTAEGKWCVMLDYYGKPGDYQGYVPFLEKSIRFGAFVRSDQSFSFPYGFKHGTVLAITEEEKQRVAKAFS